MQGAIPPLSSNDLIAEAWFLQQWEDLATVIRIEGDDGYLWVLDLPSGEDWTRRLTAQDRARFDRQFGVGVGDFAQEVHIEPATLEHVKALTLSTGAEALQALQQQQSYQKALEHVLKGHQE